MPAIDGVPVAGAQTGPCEPWAPAEACGIAITDASVELVESSLLAATEVLWALSGRRYGLCDVTVRPCRRGCWGSLSSWYSAGSGWWGIGVASSACGDGCSCGRVCDLTLPGPVGSVLGVSVDGAALDPTLYTVYDSRTLTRLDGECWPLCQRLDLPNGAEGTWSVTYTVGNDVPELGRRAVAELATEMAKACLGGPTAAGCNLPARVTDLTRQGVTMRVIDPQEFLTDGRTGLYLADLFISSVNPARLLERSRAYSPDVARPRIVT